MKRRIAQTISTMSRSRYTTFHALTFPSTWKIASPQGKWIQRVDVIAEKRGPNGMTRSATR